MNVKITDLKNQVLKYPIHLNMGDKNDMLHHKILPFVLYIVGGNLTRTN